VITDAVTYISYIVPATTSHPSVCLIARSSRSRGRRNSVPSPLTHILSSPPDVLRQSGYEIAILQHHSQTSDTLTTAKLEKSSSPPPLYYSPTVSSKGRDTKESTPIATPIEQPCSNPFGQSNKKHNLLDFAWRKRTVGSLQHEPELFEGDDWLLPPDPGEPLFEDNGESAYPLFPKSPPAHYNRPQMASSASPIDISLSPRFSSHSPRNQTSNLTFALQEAGATGIQPAEPAIDTRQDAGRLSVGGRNDSISVGGSSYFGTGARPISTGQKQRRESSTGSFVAGMSWGGMSVGSFIRDE